MIDWGVEIMGWLGSLCILTAYALLASRRLAGDQPPYHLINLVGAFLLTTYGIIKNASAMVFLNGVWLIIGFYALYAIFQRRKKAEN